MATASSSLGQVTTKWTKPAATDGPNCRRTEPSKGKSASTEEMKLSSSPVAGVLLQQPAKARCDQIDAKAAPLAPPLPACGRAIAFAGASLRMRQCHLCHLSPDAAGQSHMAR